MSPTWHWLWQIPLLALGLYSALLLVTAVVVWATTRRRRERRYAYPTTALPPIDHDGGTLQLYMTGNDLYADMLADIAAAQETILFETHSWLDDDIGRKFRQALIEKARTGCTVYIIFDLLGTRLVSSHNLRFPDLPHLHVIPFFTLRHVHDLFHLPRWGVTHRKLLIVDGRIGYVGGYNIGDRYRHWRDTHARLSGAGVADLATAFAHLWNDYRREEQPRLPYPWPEWQAQVRGIFNSPTNNDYPIRSRYLAAIMHAKQSIRITNAYLLPDRHIQRELLAAARRGVDVALLFPWRSDQTVLDWTVRRAFDRYLRAGIRLFGYENMMIHAKTLTVDGEYTLLGTANLDRLSLHINHEVDIETALPGVAEQLEQMFAADVTNAREIELTAWRNRPIQMRLGEWILAGLWPIL